MSADDPLPPGFTRLTAGRVVLDVRADLADAARAAGLLAPDATARHGATARGPAGRGATFVLAWPAAAGAAGEAALVRPLRHGGVLGPLLGGVRLGLGRARGELAATAVLWARGAPVPEPVFVWGRRIVGPLFAAAVATRLEPGCDGLAFLAGPTGAPDGARLARACRAAGVAVRRFHDAGGRHADLHLKNLLVHEQGDATRVLVLDLDRARVGEPPSPRRRMAELMRLYRSLRKRGVLERVGVRGCARFLHAYVAGDRALRAALLSRLPAERRRVAVHALAYRRP